jgi:hypothetical protein
MHIHINKHIHIYKYIHIHIYLNTSILQGGLNFNKSSTVSFGGIIKHRGIRLTCFSNMLCLIVTTASFPSDILSSHSARQFTRIGLFNIIQNYKSKEKLTFRNVNIQYISICRVNKIYKYSKKIEKDIR